MCCRTPFSHWRYILAHRHFSKSRMASCDLQKHTNISECLKLFHSTVLCILFAWSTYFQWAQHLPLAGISLLRGLQKVAPVYSHKPMTLTRWLLMHRIRHESPVHTTGSKIKAVWQVYDDMRHWERIQRPSHCRDTETLTMHFHTFTSGEDLGNNTALKLTCSTKARH